MADNRPFAAIDRLLASSSEELSALEREDWLEAFAAHPSIGSSKNELNMHSSTKEWAGSEQSGMLAAATETLTSLRQLNTEYENKFGYIFIICATGKESSEILRSIRSRLKNSTSDEFAVATGEQAKITALRIQKLLSE